MNLAVVAIAVRRITTVIILRSCKDLTIVARKRELMSISCSIARIKFVFLRPIISATGVIREAPAMKEMTSNEPNHCEMTS